MKNRSGPNILAYFERSRRVLELTSATDLGNARPLRKFSESANEARSNFGYAFSKGASETKLAHTNSATRVY